MARLEQSTPLPVCMHTSTGVSWQDLTLLHRRLAMSCTDAISSNHTRRGALTRCPAHEYEWTRSIHRAWEAGYIGSFINAVVHGRCTASKRRQTMCKAGPICSSSTTYVHLPVSSVCTISDCAHCASTHFNRFGKRSRISTPLPRYVASLSSPPGVQRIQQLTKKIHLANNTRTSRT